MVKFPNLNSLKYKYVFGLMLCVCIAVIGLAFSMDGGNDDFEISRREVLLRRIGHELLLQSGDSISRVLPVSKIAENEYHINFEHELTFQPDSLVNTITRLLASEPSSSDYVVNVLNSENSHVTYGFAISKNNKEDIVPCKGRVQPKALYTVSIVFKPAVMKIPKNGYLLGSLPVLAFVGFIFLRSVKPQKSLPKDQDSGTFNLGSVLFDANNRKLTVNETMVELTGTEARLLLIFAMSPNETISRNRLQKEIWEDEGVIVGRSLDMFISKLRRKLEIDANINIVVVRSKGYKLEVSS